MGLNGEITVKELAGISKINSFVLYPDPFLIWTLFIYTHIHVPWKLQHKLNFLIQFPSISIECKQTCAFGIQKQP